MSDHRSPLVSAVFPSYLESAGSERALRGQGSEELAPIAVDAEQLRLLPGLRGIGKSIPVVLRIPELASQEAFIAGERINRLRRACGCELGACCALVGLIAALGWLTASYGLVSRAMLFRLPLALGAAIILAGIGKAAGIALARHQLRIEIESLLRLVESRSGKE